MCRKFKSVFYFHSFNQFAKNYLYLNMTSEKNQANHRISIDPENLDILRLMIFKHCANKNESTLNSLSLEFVYHESYAFLFFQAARLENGISVSIKHEMGSTPRTVTKSNYSVKRLLLQNSCAYCTLHKQPFDAIRIERYYSLIFP